MAAVVEAPRDAMDTDAVDTAFEAIEELHDALDAARVRKGKLVDKQRKLVDEQRRETATEYILAMRYRHAHAAWARKTAGRQRDFKSFFMSMKRGDVSGDRANTVGAMGLSKITFLIAECRKDKDGGMGTQLDPERDLKVCDGFDSATAVEHLTEYMRAKAWDTAKDVDNAYKEW